MQFKFRKFVLLTAALLSAATGGMAARGKGVTEVWEGQPYHIEVSLAIDAPGDLAQQLAVELPAYMQQRANTSIGAVWRLSSEVVQGPLRHQILDGLDVLADGELPDATPDEDKRLLLAVRALPWGYELIAREYDRYVQRWGTPIRRIVRQRDAVPEQLFAIAEQAVAPLAHFRPDPADPQQMLIELRGADLPASGSDFKWLRPGDALLPIVLRKTREGAVAPKGVTTIPWTYLEIVEPAAGSTQLVGRIRSASAKPLGVRRGRVEQVAIGLRNDRRDSQLELRSRANSDKPLAGYEIFAQDGDAKEMRALGASSDAGEVTVTPGKNAVQMLYLKSGGVTLARLPIVPGASERIEVPLPDDEMRLRVAARLSAMREDIVDLVARRTIFMARVRQQIAEKNFAAARELLDSLDQLPSQTEFRVTLDRDAQLYRADDAQVQRRIDKLFAETRSVLGKFLNPRPIGELHETLRQAEQQNKDPESGSEAETG